MEKNKHTGSSIRDSCSRVDSLGAQVHSNTAAACNNCLSCLFVPVSSCWKICMFWQTTYCDYRSWFIHELVAIHTLLDSWYNSFSDFHDKYISSFQFYQNFWLMFCFDANSASVSVLRFNNSSKIVMTWSYTRQ